MWRSLHVTLIATLWILLWVVVTLIGAAPLLRDTRMPLWQALGVVLVPVAFVTAWAEWELRSARFERPELDPPWPWFRHHLRRLPIFIVMMLIAAYLTNRFLLHSFLPMHVMLAWAVLESSVLYLVWLALVFGWLTNTTMRKDTERLLGAQQALAEAQLAQLQAQLRPQFIFDALNTVAALIHADVGRAERMLAHIRDLLRASLRVDRHDEVSLKEELELFERYASIVRERFDGRVSVQWNVPAETLPARVPALLLQPLVENAFEHGIEKSGAAGRITIRAERRGDELRIDVLNTCPGMKGSTNGVGLQNCRERLYLLYNSQASLDVAAEEGGGVKASVTLPWRPTIH
ncbi:MAG TPA: histidine kinase [Steroidobacteraceae bacterium]|jgi:sensor histidine kinase YesM|nr:histidine kinase [Steroidobacteraceae bacterium]